MLEELRKILLNIVDNIDSGNSNIDETKSIEIAVSLGELLARYNKPKEPNEYTRIAACKYLRISETKFNYLRRKHLISDGHKVAGDVRKWTKQDLDSYIQKSK